MKIRVAALSLLFATSMVHAQKVWIDENWNPVKNQSDAKYYYDTDTLTRANGLINFKMFMVESNRVKLATHLKEIQFPNLTPLGLTLLYDDYGELRYRFSTDEHSAKYDGDYYFYSENGELREKRLYNNGRLISKESYLDRNTGDERSE